MPLSNRYGFVLGGNHCTYSWPKAGLSGLALRLYQCQTGQTPLSMYQLTSPQQSSSHNLGPQKTVDLRDLSLNPAFFIQKITDCNT